MGMHVLTHAGQWRRQAALTKRWQEFCPTRQPLERGLRCPTQPALRTRRSGFRPRGSRASRAHPPPQMMRAGPGWSSGGPSAQRQVRNLTQPQSISTTRSAHLYLHTAPARACSTPLHAGSRTSLPQMLHKSFGCMPANVLGKDLSSHQRLSSTAWGVQAGSAARRPSSGTKAVGPKVDSWRWPKDRPPARASATLEERLLGGPSTTSSPLAAAARRYKGPDPELAAALES